MDASCEGRTKNALNTGHFKDSPQKKHGEETSFAASILTGCLATKSGPLLRLDNPNRGLFLHAHTTPTVRKGISRLSPYDLSTHTWTRPCKKDEMHPGFALSLDHRLEAPPKTAALPPMFVCLRAVDPAWLFFCTQVLARQQLTTTRSCTPGRLRL